MIGDDERILCLLAELPEGSARGFLPNAQREDQLFAVRRGAAVYVYLNTCPHNWRPLDWAKDQFQARPGGDIVCFAHGAHFDARSGECIAGVCLGDYLIAVPARTEAGQVIIPARLPSHPD
jgi:nitrite reductase/ring-hydroxylating ferredoxin subunit